MAKKLNELSSHLVTLEWTNERSKFEKAKNFSDRNFFFRNILDFDAVTTKECDQIKIAKCL